MTIKRALMAALSILLIPSFALAQNTHTFATSVDVPSNGTHPELDATITCDGGIPLTQSAMTPVTFTVTELGDDANCAIVLSNVEDGWEVISDPCVYNPVGSDLAHECVIDIEPEETTFSVDVDWNFSSGADEGFNDAATVNMVCVNTQFGIITNYNVPAGPDADFPLTMNFTPAPDGLTDCAATLNNTSSGVEIDPKCPSFDVEIGDGPVSCTIGATVFYEGIPTLSQYGMVIMILLMMGVGAIGFRRFS